MGVGLPLKALASLVKASKKNKDKEVPVLSKSKQKKLKKLEVPVWSITNLFFSFFSKYLFSLVCFVP